MKRDWQKVLREYLEELEDVRDVKRALQEPTRPLSDVLQELQIHGAAAD